MDNKANNDNCAPKSCFWKIICGPFKFFGKFCCKKQKEELIKEEKKIREDLSEKKIDKMVKDSFPASDPPSTY